MTGQHSHNPQKLLILRTCVLLTLGAMIAEFAGGMFSNSLSLVSDAWHMLVDVFALGMSYFAVLLSLQPVTKKRTYGLHRAEVLAAFLNAILLIVVSLYLIYEALGRSFHPEPVKIKSMLSIAVFGLFINGVSISLLGRAGSSHDLNVRGALLHQVSDLISSIAVVAGAIIIYFSGKTIFDPLISITIALLIIFSAGKLLHDSTHILLEATPQHLDIDHLVSTIKTEVEGVYEVRHVHAWTIASSLYALTAQVVIKDCHLSDTKATLEKINKILNEKYHIGHTNIQFECLLEKNVKDKS